VSLDILVREPNGGIRRSGALVIDAGTAVTETAGGLPELRLGFVGAKAWLFAPVTLPSGVPTPIPFDNVLFDEGGFFDVSPGSPTPTRATVPAGKHGMYMVIADGLFTNGTACNREVQIRKNGVQLMGVSRIHQAGAFVTTVVTEIFPLGPGDYLEMVMLQDSGATQYAFGGSDESRTSFTLMRLGA
jgi:hypothetical protein